MTDSKHSMNFFPVTDTFIYAHTQFSYRTLVIFESVHAFHFII